VLKAFDHLIIVLELGRGDGPSPEL